jgi:hypothetical protein
MSGRIVATQIKTTDQPELPKEAQEQLEMDKLYFLDQENRGKMVFLRPLVPGEELPFKLHETAMVQVKPGAREFYVFDKQTLVIIEPAEAKKKQAKHEQFGIDGILSYYAKVRKEHEGERPKAVKLIPELRPLRRQQERARQDERRKARQEKRDGIRAVKRIEKLNKVVARRGGMALVGDDGPELVLLQQDEAA